MIHFYTYEFKTTFLISQLISPVGATELMISVCLSMHITQTYLSHYVLFLDLPMSWWFKPNQDENCGQGFVPSEAVPVHDGFQCIV